TAGLRAYRDGAERMRELRWPGARLNGLEPWVLLGDATALTAHAYYATGSDVDHGWALFKDCLGRVRRLLESADPQLDLPVLGAALFGLASWGLLRDALPAHTVPRLLALAERFAYNRATPSMEWQRIEPQVKNQLPGQLEKSMADYRKPRPRELLNEAGALVEQLPRCSEIPLVAANGQRREDRDNDNPGQ
ncbi:MAG: hypothetical protein J2P17_30645, partial [Mycobacterium sp.]|nr:hypothetical protein [Mycobacterium sp.]